MIERIFAKCKTSFDRGSRIAARVGMPSRESFISFSTCSSLIDPVTRPQTTAELPSIPWCIFHGFYKAPDLVGDERKVLYTARRHYTQGYSLVLAMLFFTTQAPVNASAPSLFKDRAIPPTCPLLHPRTGFSRSHLYRI